jgi:putative spermidine/putrescine transport system ATP-binding protein
MQTELKGLQQRLGITFVFVTHDQGEALSMANRVAVFDAGRIEQLDTPRALYTRPKTAFVAAFVGSANVVERDLAERLTGRTQPFAIRPELIRIVGDGAVPADHVSAEGVLEHVLYHGATSRYHVRIDGAVLAVAQAETGGAVAVSAPGARVRIAWPKASAVPLD